MDPTARGFVRLPFPNRRLSLPVSMTEVMGQPVEHCHSPPPTENRSRARAGWARRAGGRANVGDQALCKP